MSPIGGRRHHTGVPVVGASRPEPARRAAGEPSDIDEPADDAALYARHADELVRFATMLVGPSGAEDVVADAVVRVFRSRSWPRVTARRAYLFKAVYREAQMRHRSAQRRLAREIASSAGEPPAAHDQRVALALDRDLLVALRALTVRQRAAVFLTHWLDHPPAAVASALHVTVRTVQRDLATAYRRLEELLR